MCAEKSDCIDVFLLAENRLLREALARVLDKKNDIRVVAAVANGNSPYPPTHKAANAPFVTMSSPVLVTATGKKTSSAPLMYIDWCIGGNARRPSFRYLTNE